MPIYLPEKCLRGRDDCVPYSQIEADDKKSFICMGCNGGKMSDVKTDIFTFCWKNEQFDERSCVDERDIIDTASVMMQGLSVHANLKNDH